MRRGVVFLPKRKKAYESIALEAIKRGRSRVTQAKGRPKAMATGQMSGVLRRLRRAAFIRDGGGLTDGQLLERFLTRREEAAFEELVRRHGPMC
jgi:hypothetical protein